MRKIKLFTILLSCTSLMLFAQTTTVLHQADFESGFDGWTQSSSDDIDWTRNSGGTPSSSTGPSVAYSGSYYIYTEASGNSNKKAILESPDFDLTGTINPRFTFFFHMHGGDTSNNYMGTLTVSLSTDGGASYPTTLWTKSGWVQQQDVSSWIPVSVDLRSYIGQTIKIKIEGKTSGDYRSDMAVDNITLIDKTNPTLGPGGITNNLSLWFKADDGLHTDGNSVSTWKNKGLGSDAKTHFSGQEPIYRDNATKNVNFNPVVEFSNSYNTYTQDTDYSHDNTSSQFLTGDYGYFTEELFIVLVTNDTPITSSFGFMDVYCGDSDLKTNAEDATGIGFGYYTARINGEIICYAHSTFDNTDPGDGYAVAEIGTGSSYDNIGIINTRNNTANTQQELFYNANDIETTQNDVIEYMNTDDTRFWIGRSEGWEASLNARVVEVISYSSRKDDATERRKIESYLAIKYGITLGTNGTSQNYVDSNGSIIWDVSANSGFNYDIAGIGRDDSSELNQKQSKSVNTGSLVTIGLGEISATNSANPNSFSTDRDYLVWGNNNGAFNTSSETQRSITLSSSTTTFTPVSRKWKIIESQNDVPEVVLSIPTTDLTTNIPLSSNEEHVLIVSSGSGFNATDIIDVIPLTVNGANSEVWYDFDGTKYFTIGKATRVVENRRVSFAPGEFLLGGNTLDLPANFTVSAWIQNNANGGSFISKGTAYNFKVNASNRIEVSWNGSVQITSTNSIDAKWHHIALTFSGGTANLYVDGTFSASAFSLPTPVANNTTKFTIGALYTDKNTVSSFDGSVDEVRIWDAALSIAEIRYIMNQEIQEFSTMVDGVVLPQSITKNDIASRSWSNLQAYYNMNSFYGSTVEDNSSNKNWARIKYLTKDKQVVETQTAPLPYQSTSDGNWDTASTWLNNTVQYLPNTTINGIKVDWNIVETNNNVVANRDIKLLGLKTNSNELSISSDNSLTVTHYLLLNGVIDLDGESQLIQTTGSDLDVSSTGYLERDQQGEGNRYRYNYWSSPVLLQGSGNTSSTPLTIAGVLKDGTNPLSPASITFTSGLDGSQTTPITLSTYWMYKFANLTDDDYSAWQYIGSTGNILAGEGFTMKGTGAPGSPDQNYVFVGKPNNGDISLTVSGTNDYLVGNPYPSAIDADQFIQDNISSITGTLYFWEHYGGDSHNLGDYEGGYATYTLAGGVGTGPATPDPDVNQTGSGTKTPDRYIPVAQGFFVVGDADGGAIVFNNGQRIFVTEASGNSIFMRTNTGQVEVDERFKIRLGFESTHDSHRQILLTVDERTTEDADWGFDGKLYESLPQDIYWVINDDEYVIQAIPSIQVDKEIPLGIKMEEEGLITINLDEIENNKDEFYIYIEDKSTGEIVDLTKQNFEINLDEGEYDNRFFVVFKAKESISEGEVEVPLKKVIVFMNNNTSQLQINNTLGERIQSISVYNYLGQPVKSWGNIPNESILSFPFDKIPGMYMVEILTQKERISEKILVN